MPATTPPETFLVFNGPTAEDSSPEVHEQLVGFAEWMDARFPGRERQIEDLACPARTYSEGSFAAGQRNVFVHGGGVCGIETHGTDVLASASLTGYKDGQPIGVSLGVYRMGAAEYVGGPMGQLLVSRVAFGVTAVATPPAGRSTRSSTVEWQLHPRRGAELAAALDLCQAVASAGTDPADIMKLRRQLSATKLARLFASL